MIISKYFRSLKEKRSTIYFSFLKYVVVVVFFFFFFLLKISFKIFNIRKYLFYFFEFFFKLLDFLFEKNIFQTKFLKIFIQLFKSIMYNFKLMLEFTLSSSSIVMKHMFVTYF